MKLKVASVTSHYRPLPLEAVEFETVTAMEELKLEKLEPLDLLLLDLDDELDD